MGRPRPAVGGSHSHSLDSVPSPGPGQRKYLCVGVPKGGYSVRLLGAKTEIPDNWAPFLRRPHEHLPPGTIISHPLEKTLPGCVCGAVVASLFRAVVFQ